MYLEGMSNSAIAMRMEATKEGYGRENEKRIPSQWRPFGHSASFQLENMQKRNISNLPDTAFIKFE